MQDQMAHAEAVSKIAELVEEIEEWKAAAEKWGCSTPKELEEHIFALPETY